MTKVKRPNVSTVLLLAVLLLVVGYQSFAARPAALQSRTVVTVNLQKVFEGLEQRNDGVLSLQQMSREIQKEAERREAEIEQMQQQLRGMIEAMQPGETPSAEAQRLEEQMVLENLRYQAWLSFQSDKLDVEFALLLQDLFRTVRKAAEQMANSEGYDLVVLDDSREELTVNPESRQSRERQIRQQLSARSILYARDAVDISTELVQRMNNEYRAAQR